MNTEQMINYLRSTHNKDLHRDYLNHILSYDSFELSWILVDDVNSDLVNINTNKVSLYSLLDKSTVPPIVVADGVILDGYHRVTVAKAQGQMTIPAWIGVKAPL